MDRARIAALRDVLATTGWVDRTRRFGAALRGAGHRPGGLLVVGTPHDEPWHLTAHLDEEARWSGVPELRPALVRWSPPAGAPAHLAIGLDRLEHAGRGETVFVVAEEEAPPELLERVDDARHDGAVILALDGGDRQLEGLAHEALTVPPPAGMERVDSGLLVPRGSAGLPPVSFDLVSHLVSVAAGEPDPAGRAGPGRRGARGALGRLLDALSGPPGGDDAGQWG